MYTLEIPLKVKYNQNRYLAKVFFYKFKIKSVLINWCNKNLKALQNTWKYKNLIQQYRKETDKKRKRKISNELNKLVDKYHLNRKDIYKFLNEQHKKYKKYFNSFEINAIGDETLHGLEQILYIYGEQLKYKSLYNSRTIATKILRGGGINLINNDKVLIGRIYKPSSNIICKLNIDPKNLYIQECLLEDSDKIKYCRLKRRQFPNYYHYYIQLIIDSKPPNKLKIKDGTSGIDIGTQTVAVVNDNKCILTELAMKTDEYNKQIQKLQRKLDKSRQETNKDLYDKDGTVKKGSKGKFKKSKNYIKLQRQLRTIYRKKSEYTRQEHNKLVNEIMQMSKQGVYIEPMNYRALAKKSKSKIQKSNNIRIIKGKKVQLYKKKRRFGKSINNKSPGLFINILKYKCEFNNIPYYEIDRTSFKASQYNHLTDTYIKKDLNQRWNILGKDKIQRDLYSAFLIKNSNSELTKPDRLKCIEEFNNFKKLHNKEIKRLVNSNNKKLNSFGF